MYTINFNNQYIGSPDYEIDKIDLGMPKSKVNKYELVRADGQIVTNKNYGERNILVTGRVLANDLTQMQTRLDTLKSWQTLIDCNLDIDYNGAIRRYIATVESFTYKEVGYFTTFELRFTADALGKATASTSLSYGTYTSSNSAYTNAITGSYKSKACFDFTVNQVDPYWTTKYIDIANNALNQRIRLTRTWNWYDRVVIDGEAKTVSLYETTKTEIDDCDTITAWTSANTLSLETSLMKEGVGALKVVMASAIATSYVDRLNATAVDLSSSMGKIIIPVFIPTPTTGTVASVDLYLGSDATFGTNFSYWRVTTQWNGSAIASNSWNYFVIDLSTAATSTTGTPVRTAIKSIKVLLNATTTMQLNGWLVDYITLQKASITSTPLDYEGTFPELAVGSNSITITDELTSRNITVTGSYTKKYL